MKYKIVSSLALGICSFLGLYMLNVKAEVGIQSLHPSKLGQVYSLDTRAKDDDGIDLSGVSLIKSRAPKSKIFKRAQHYTPEEVELLLELREQGMTWKEISKSFPGREWQSLKDKHRRVLREQEMGKSPRLWTSEEEELLLKLVEPDKSWGEIAESLPGRTPKAVRQHYKILNDGSLAPKKVRLLYTAEEDKLLLKLKKADMPWKEMPAHFDNRTWPSLRSRYKALGQPFSESREFYTTEEDKLLLKLKKAGVPWKEMPAHFDNRTQRSLEGRYKALGQPFSEHPTHYTTEEDSIVINGVESGMTAEQISRLLRGRSKTSVQTRKKRLRELGQLKTIRSGRNYTAADLELIDELFKDGMSGEDIATEYFPERSGQGVKLAHWRYQNEREKESKL